MEAGRGKAGRASPRLERWGASARSKGSVLLGQGPGEVVDLKGHGCMVSLCPALRGAEMLALGSSLDGPACMAWSQPKTSGPLE